ncbi:MAG: prepilin-type N-terminal cleavage/methylation domain-containing protein [Betaproteobacteria bacterium]|nr:MAG: prepilin-type N-terminal cleavage/methylation domain-containing protein [Betaproteobacteria bacterium]
MKKRLQLGFTLIELMVTIAIVAILAAIAIPNLQSFLDSSKLDGITQDLRSSIALARSEAIKRGQRVFLLAKTSGGSKLADGWRVFVEDPAQPATFSSAAILVQETGSYSSDLLTGGGSVNTFNNFEGFAFNGRGQPLTATGGFGAAGLGFQVIRGGSTVKQAALCMSSLGRVRIAKDSTPAAACGTTTTEL